MLQVRNKVGEELYVAINKSHPTLAGKLTGMFLEATEVLCIREMCIYERCVYTYVCEWAYIDTQN